MPALLPLEHDFLLRALLGGGLVAVLCGVVGTWVVVRGMAFLGEALAHGLLPGVAVASLLGFPVLLGGAVSAVVMTLGIGLLRRRARLSYDTSIGMLFVGMLALGVLIISRSGSFATDTTAILFGEILAISSDDLAVLAAAVAAAVLVAFLGHRALVAVAVDARIARTVGVRPAVADAILIGLVTLAVVASYQAVGSLLVVGLLLAPAVGARCWTHRIPTTMLLAALLGLAAVVAGLSLSWHAGTAAGASIALAAIAIALASRGLRAAIHALRARIPARSIERTSCVPPSP